MATDWYLELRDRVRRGEHLHGRSFDASLRVKRRERLYAYAEGQAKRLGIEEESVPPLVKEIRRDTSARDR